MRCLALLARYDAVTTQGWLEWQNSLTSLNQPFFDAADSLFVNYTWKEGTPREVAKAAGVRQARGAAGGVERGSAHYRVGVGVVEQVWVGCEALCLQMQP